MASISSDCRRVSVRYLPGISLSPELGCRPRLETGFISLLDDLSMTAAGLHICFLSPVWMMAGNSASATSSFLIIVPYECPLQPCCLTVNLQIIFLSVFIVLGYLD